MNNRQAASSSDGKEPDAARTPDEDKGFELPPPPAPGALWASPSVSDETDGRDSAPSNEAAPGKSVDRFSGSTRPISAVPGAGAARAMVPGALTGDDAGLRALTWPSGGSHIYGGPAEAHDAASARQMSQPDRPEPEPEPDEPEPGQPDPGQPDPGQPDPGQPEPVQPEPVQPRPSRPGPGDPTKPAEPFKPFDPPAPIEPPPGPFPSPAPPGPGPSPVPGPPQPIFPPPPVISSAAGLPAYTMPPVNSPPPTGGTAPAEPRTSVWQRPYDERDSDQTIVGSPLPSWNQPSGDSNGVGSPGAVRQPFGGHGDVGRPPTQHATYGQSSTALPPQQRGAGTVYGAQNPADMTMPVNMNAMDNSGSLTGHILAQGWDRGEDTGRRSNVKVGIAMAVVLLFLVGMSLLFLFTAGDAFTDMINGVFNKG